MRCKRCQFGSYRSAMKGLYSWGRNSFSSLSRLVLQRGDWNIRCGTPSRCATSSSSLVEIGQ
jgi:hypothetical protein